MDAGLSGPVSLLSRASACTRRFARPYRPDPGKGSDVKFLLTLPDMRFGYERRLCARSCHTQPDGFDVRYGPHNGLKSVVADVREVPASDMAPAPTYISTQMAAAAIIQTMACA